MGLSEKPTRRTVLGVVGTGVVGTGVATMGVTGQDGEDGRDRGAGRDRERIDIRIDNCHTATVRTRHPDAYTIHAGLYFRETDRYDFHQAAVDFPHTLNLCQYDWARDQGAVLTGVTVEDVDFNTLASESVPDGMTCEDGASAVVSDGRWRRRDH